MKHMKYLYHFFDKRTGPFKSLTAVSCEEAHVWTDDVIRDYM